MNWCCDQFGTYRILTEVSECESMDTTGRRETDEKMNQHREYGGL